VFSNSTKRAILTSPHVRDLRFGHDVRSRMKHERNYRWPTIAVTVACLVLAVFCVWWQFIVYVDYRSADFTKVSKGPILGTCVEAVTEDMLKSARYDKADWDCTETSKQHISNLLAVSVHALYYANISNPLDAEGARVLASLISTTQGTSADQITKTQAYNALKNLGTPTTDCAAIYPGRAEEGTPNARPPSVVCDTETPANGTAIVADTNALYTHCLHQFSYARSYPADGTFSIPKVGVQTSPIILPIIETNAKTPWFDRARIVVGTRCVLDFTIWTQNNHHSTTIPLAHSCPTLTQTQLGLLKHRLHRILDLHRVLIYRLHDFFARRAYSN